MMIIAHRGLHSQAILPNSPDALINACSLGFGIETDLRDFSRTLAPHNTGCCLALNLRGEEILC